MITNKPILLSFRLMVVLCLLITETAFIKPVHRYYFSFTEIHVDTKKQTLNVSCKLFTDDLDEALFKKYGKKINLVSKNKEAEDILNKYINENFKITIGDKLQKLSFVGFENDADAIWCYFEAESFKEKGKVEVSNTLLYDYLPEQCNVINFYWDKVDKSAKLTNPEKTAIFEF